MPAAISGQANYTTGYEYDLRDNLTYIHEGYSSGSFTPVRTTHNIYDLRDRLIAVDDPNPTGDTSTTTLYAYNGANQITSELTCSGDSPISSGYMTDADLLSYTSAVWGNGGDARLTQYCYNYLGQLWRVFHPDPDKAGPLLPLHTDFAYDLNGNRTGVATKTASESTLLSTTTYYDNLNRPWSTENNINLGEMTETLFNPDGTVYQTSISTSSGLATTTYAYDGLGRVWHTISPDPVEGNPGNTKITETYYDAAGNLIKAASLRNGGGFDNVVEYTYDNLGRNTVIETQVAVVKNGNGSYSTDVPLNTIKVYNPDGSLDYTYAENMGSAINTDYTYDNLGRVLSTSTVKDPDLQNSGSTLETLVTSYSYNTLGFLLTLCDPDGNQTGHLYDELGRVTHEYLDANNNGSLDTGELYRYYQYDSFGQLDLYTDRNGRTTVYDYNNIGLKTYESWSGDTYSANYTYTPLGQIDTASDSNSAYDYDYYLTQQLEKVSYTHSGISGDFTYGYDLLGNVTDVAANMGGSSAYTNSYLYDLIGRVTTVTQTAAGSPTKQVDYTYGYCTISPADTTSSFSAAEVLSKRKENGTYIATTSSLTWEDGRSAGVFQYQGDNGSSSPFDNYLSYYDENGMMAYKTSILDPDYHYLYDSTGQMTASDDLGTAEDDERFEYSANGNPQGVEIEVSTGTGTSDTVDTTKTDPYNRLAADLNHYYKYDNEGNMIERWTYDTVTPNPVVPGDQATSVTLTDPGRDGAANTYRLSFNGLIFDDQTGVNEDAGIFFTVWLKDINESETKVATSSASFFNLEFSAEGWDHYIATSEYPYFEFVLPSGSSDDTIVVKFHVVGSSYDAQLNSTGAVILSRVSELEKFEWDYRNRLVDVKKYVTGTGTSRTTYTYSGSTTTPVYVSIDNNTIHYRDNFQYTYDVHDQLIGKSSQRNTDQGGIHIPEYYVNERGHRVLTIDNSQSITKRTLWDPTAVDQVLAVENWDSGLYDDIYWPLTDQQGTVRNTLTEEAVDLSTQTGQNKVHMKYGAWGLPDEDYMGLQGNYSFALDNFYAGRELDRDTDLYYNRARWYDPAAGRFINEDPIGFAGGDANLYRYCFNSPGNATDPSGNFIITGAIVGASLLIGGASTGALYYSAAQYDATSEAMGSARTAAEYACVNDMYHSARMWHATGEIGGATAFAIAAAPAIGAAGGAYVGGMTAAFGTWGTIAASTSLLTVGGGMLGSEVYDIGRDWNQMDNIERYHRVGMIVGPTVGGIGSGWMTKSWVTTGYRAGFASVALGRQAIGRSLSSLATKISISHGVSELRTPVTNVAEVQRKSYNPWKWITGEPTRAFPEARSSFYRIVRSDEFANHFGFSRVGAANRSEYAAFLKMVRNAEFRQSNIVQGGWAGRGSNGNIVLALSRRNLNSSWAATHELTHLVRHARGITPFESEASMRGIFRYRAWVEEARTWWHMWKGD